MTDKSGKLAPHDWVERGSLDKLSTLLDNGKSPDERSMFGETPLHSGAELGREDIVEVLISHGADVNVKDKYGVTPLHKCALHGHKETVKILISHGADFNVKDNSGQTPLYDSASQGHKEIVEALISHGADVNVKGAFGQTPLHGSACQGHKEIVDVLISHGADVNIKNNFGQTPLHGSACEGHGEIIEFFISRGADVNVKSRREQTPLHFSAINGQIETVQILLKHKADIDPVDFWGDTPLTCAEQRGHKDIVKILRQAKPIQAGDSRLRRVISGIFGYSSSTKKVSVQSSDDKGQLTKYESEEVKSQMTGITTSTPAPASSLSSVPISASPLTASTSPATTSASSSPSSPGESIDEVTQLAQKLLKAVKSKRKPGDDNGGICQDPDSFYVPTDHLGGNVIVIKNKTVNNHYHNTYYNNEQITRKELKVETTEKLNVNVGGTRYGVLCPPEGDDHERKNEDGNMYRTGEDRDTMEDGRGGQTSDNAMIDDNMSKTNTVESLTALPCAVAASTVSSLSLISPNTSSPPTTTTSSLAAATTISTAAEIRRRIESQADYMEKMVQSCVAGGGVCQDQNSDFPALQHGNGDINVNLNFIMQPKHVEVYSAKQVTCEKVDAENAEMVASNCPITYKYGPQQLSDDEDNENSTDDDSKDDLEIHIEDAEDEFPTR